MLSLVLSGGVGCVLAYGQTGSGKTYTMESVEHRIARDLFDKARVMGKRLLLAQGGEHPASETGDIFEFNVTFLELLGKHASDLLESTTEVDALGNPIRSEVSVREDKVSSTLGVCPFNSFDSRRWVMCDRTSSPRRFAHRPNWRN
jgi:kinesin family protein 2/24